jgi:hypothetical protein
MEIVMKTKTKAYKVVCKSDYGKLLSLYAKVLPSRFIIEYDENPTDPSQMIFVANNICHAQELSEPFNPECIEIWECEGYLIGRWWELSPEEMQDLDDHNLSIWIDPDSSFMTEVSLIRRV